MRQAERSPRRAPKHAVDVTLHAGSRTGQRAAGGVGQPSLGLPQGAMICSPTLSYGSGRRLGGRAWSCTRMISSRRLVIRWMSPARAAWSRRSAVRVVLRGPVATSHWCWPAGPTRRCGCTGCGWPGSYASLRDRDLRFSLAESGDLMASFGVHVAAEDLAVLHRSSEGWAAALQMAALSLHSTTDPSARRPRPDQRRAGHGRASPAGPARGQPGAAGPGR
jgi:hypothetical protein